MWTFVVATIMLFTVLFVTEVMPDVENYDPIIVRESYNWLDKEEGLGNSTIMSFKVWILNPEQDTLSLTIKFQNYDGIVFDSLVRVQYGDTSRVLFKQKGDTTIFKYVKPIPNETYGLMAVLNVHDKPSCKRCGNCNLCR